jgi:Ca2+-binding EF-hand superfamily protein
MSFLTLSQLESLRRAWTTLAPDDEDLVPADLKRVLEMLGFAPTDDELRHLVIEAANEHLNGPTDFVEFCPVLARVYSGELPCKRAPTHSAAGASAPGAPEASEAD